MKKFSLPILLTILIITLATLAIIYLNIEEYSAIGSLIGGFGSVLAVIWFFTSLQYQARQLEEQRGQFLTEFQQIREDGRRNALVLAKDILNETERRALAQNPKLKSIADLASLYINFADLKPITEESDPLIVRQHITAWLQKEGPAVTLMQGIKSAAEIYFRAIGLNNIDYSRNAEEFVFIYGVHLWKIPFFSIYRGHATMLAEIMISLLPGREAVSIASMASLSMTAPTKGIMKDDKIKNSIKNHEAKGYPLPRIAKIYLEKN